MKIKSLLFVGLLLSPALYAQEKKQPTPQLPQQVQQQQTAMKDLFELKGQLVTTIEVAQAQLAEVNKAISEQLNKQINK